MAAETPLVHRTVRSGGILLVVASLQFVVAMVLVQSQYPGFSLSATRVTALAGAPSPWGSVFSASLVVLGLLSVFALLLVWSAFDSRPTRSIGLFLLIAGSACAAAFGLASLLSAGSVGTWARYVGAPAVGLGLLVLPFAMHQETRWRASRIYTLASGVLLFVAAGLYASGMYLGLGPGGMERLALAAAVLWPIVEGAHIALLHRFAPGLHVKVAAA